MSDTKKILVADDERAMANALKLKLEHEGFTVDTAANGVEALNLLKKNSYELLLLDLVMPKKDGFAVLAEMKDEKIKTPVIVTSNLGQEEDQKKVAAFGVKGYFIKSNTPITELVSHIKKAVGK
jgi:DNA-binding response OmpR family regulator